MCEQKHSWIAEYWYKMWIWFRFPALQSVPGTEIGASKAEEHKEQAELTSFWLWQRCTLSSSFCHRGEYFYSVLSLNSWILSMLVSFPLFSSLPSSSFPGRSKNNLAETQVLAPSARWRRCQFTDFYRNFLSVTLMPQGKESFMLNSINIYLKPTSA